MESGIEGYMNQLKNKMFGLLCEYEKGRNWEKFLDAILIELKGFDDGNRPINFYKLYYKLAACRYLSYDYFRKTIFDCMELVGRGI